MFLSDDAMARPRVNERWLHWHAMAFSVIIACGSPCLNALFANAYFSAIARGVAAISAFSLSLSAGVSRLMGKGGNRRRRVTRAEFVGLPNIEADAVVAKGAGA